MRQSELREISLNDIFLNLLIFTGKHKHLFIGFLLSGVLLAGVMYSLSPPSYHSEMIAYSNMDNWDSEELKPKYASVIEIISLIRGLNAYIENDDIELLSQALDCDTSFARKILEIDAELYTLDDIDDNLVEDLPLNYIKVSVSVSDFSVIKDMSSKIQNFIYNNNLIAEKYKLRKKALTKLAENFWQEKQIIDSLKVASGKNADLFFFNGAESYHKESADFFYNELLSKIKGNEITAFTVLVDFIPQKNNQNSILKFMGFFVGIMLIFGIILAIFIDSVKKINAEKNKIL